MRFLRPNSARCVAAQIAVTSLLLREYSATLPLMRVLELFAGAGGAALGLEAAGCKHIACVEWDEDSCKTLAAAGLPVVLGDVQALPISQGTSPDLIWSSFPCQAWSEAGNRKGSQDDRNGWPWTIQAIDITKPSWVIAENVRGITTHRAACNQGTSCLGPELCPNAYFSQVILADLRQRFAWVDWRILDSADYGVPQRRRRVFIIAGPNRIDWPEPTHQDPADIQPLLFGTPRQPWTTVRQALGLDAWGTTTGFSGDGKPGAPRSPDAPSCQPVAGGKALGGLYGWDPKHPPCTLDAPAEGIRIGGSGHSAPQVWLANRASRGTPITGVDQPAPTVQTPGTGGYTGRLSLVSHGRPSHPERKQSVDQPAPTVVSASKSGGYDKLKLEILTGLNDGGKPGGNQGARSVDQPSPSVRACDGTSLALRVTGGGANPRSPADSGGRRRLTTSECACLQDFPAGYPFQGTKTSQYRQIGNAVTPIVAQRIAEQILEAKAK